MKKFQLIVISSLILACGVFATVADENNANLLAQEGIIVDQSSNPTHYRFGDKILRQEIVAIALKMRGVELPQNYACKKYFSDVTANGWVCRAVELAADNGIISKTNNKFRATDSVTRAEALAMLSGVVCLPRLTLQEYTLLQSANPELIEQHSNKNDWQKTLWESISFGNKDDGLSSMNSADNWTDVQKKQSNNPNDAILRSEVFASSEFFLSYQKKYGACEKTARQPIIFWAPDEISGIPNKTTGESTSSGTYTIQYPDALVSGEVRYSGMNKGGIRTSIPFYWSFKSSTKTPLLTQKKLQFFSIGSTHFAAIYGYESPSFYRVKIFEYGNYWVKDVQFYDPAKKIDLSEDARAAGSDNPSLEEYSATDIKVEWNSLFLETADTRRLKKFQYSDGIFTRVADIVL